MTFAGWRFPQAYGPEVPLPLLAVATGETQ